MLAKRRHVHPVVQRQKIKDMEFADAPYPGAMLFAVSKPWWEEWVAFVGYNDGQKRETRSMKRMRLNQGHGLSSPRSRPANKSLETQGRPSPGPVDNSKISHSLQPAKQIEASQSSITERPLRKTTKGVLKAGVKENKDYVLVSERMWKYFLQWYGLGKGYEVSFTCNGPHGTLKSLRIEPTHLERSGGESSEMNPSHHQISVQKSSKSSSVPEKELVSTQNTPPKERDAGKPVTKGADVAVAAATTACPEKGKRKKKISPPGVAGLLNLGNTCYLNCVIQCLSNTPPLTEYFVSNRFLYDLPSPRREAFKNEIESLANWMERPLGTRGRGGSKVVDQQECTVVTAFQKVIREIWMKSHRSSRLVSPATLKRVFAKRYPEFQNMTQHDAQEALMALLNELHEEMNVPSNSESDKEMAAKESHSDDESIAGNAQRGFSAGNLWEQYRSNHDSFIVDLFYGQLKSTVSCTACAENSTSYEPFSCLSVPIPVFAPDVKKEQVTVLDCLEEYFSKETINCWRCPKCAVQRQATKQLEIVIVPKVLIVHLKRFEQSADGNTWNKVYTPVQFPFTDLDMAPFLSEKWAPVSHDQTAECSFEQRDSNDKEKLVDLALESDLWLSSESCKPCYDLYAIMNHTGDRGVGHYTAFAKNCVTSTWFKFDDSSTSSCKSSQLETSNAYVLMYHRRTEESQSSDQMDGSCST